MSNVISPTPTRAASALSIRPASRSIRLPQVLVTLFIWTGIGLLTALYHYLFNSRMGLRAGLPFLRLAGYMVPMALLWWLATPFVLLCGRRFPLISDSWRRHLVVHLVACFLTITAILFLGSAWILVAFPLPLEPGTRYVDVLGYFAPDVYTHEFSIYWMILGVGYARTYYGKFRERELRAARLETQLAEARMQALQMQLQPHFLFNTLNALQALVLRQETSRAVEMLNRLAAFLRTTLEEQGTQEVTLRRELAFTDEYLAIEKIRFPDRLAVGLEIEPDAFDALVPHLILQPLLENAIRHGISQREEGGRIDIRARRDGGHLWIEVWDDGPGLRPDTPSGGHGIGLANVRNRLETLYGPRQELQLREAPGGGLECRLRLPYRRTEAGSGTAELDRGAGRASS